MPAEYFRQIYDIPAVKFDELSLCNIVSFSQNCERFLMLLNEAFNFEVFATEDLIETVKRLLAQPVELGERDVEGHRFQLLYASIGDSRTIRLRRVSEIVIEEGPLGTQVHRPVHHIILELDLTATSFSWAKPIAQAN